jgi:hypothetical protein
LTPTASRATTSGKSRRSASQSSSPKPPNPYRAAPARH